MSKPWQRSSSYCVPEKKKPDTDIITYGHVFLYTAVVPDTYWFTRERTVWPYNALNQREGADKLRSIWSPNGPRDPLFSATVSAWSKPLLIWTGIMYSRPSEGSLAPRSRDKNKYRNRVRCDTGALPEEWQQVGGGMATSSQICQVCTLTAMKAFHGLCFLLSAFLLENGTLRGARLWLQNF